MKKNAGTHTTYNTYIIWVDRIFFKISVIFFDILHTYFGNYF